MNICVPYEDFIEGQRAIAVLNTLRKMAERGNLYSTDIPALLDARREEDKSAGAD